MKQLVVLALVVFCSSFGHGFVGRHDDIEDDLEKLVELGAEIDGKYREWKGALPKDVDGSFQQFYQEMHDKEQQQGRENLYSSALDQLNSMENEELPNEEVSNSSRLLHQLLETKDADMGMRVKRLSCSCSGLQCSCCQRINVPAIKFNENCCVTVKYLKKDIGLAVTMTAGSKFTFSKEVSARNPPPICYSIPYLPLKLAAACVEFYDMTYSRKNLRGCANFLIQVRFLRDYRFHLGCFSLDTGLSKRDEYFSYDRPASIETAAESEANEDEPRYQRLNDKNQPLNDEDVVLNERFQE